MRKQILPLLLVPLLLAACGRGQPAAPAAREEADATAGAEPSAPLPSEQDDDQVTAIDAASGDGAGLPADSNGPSRYDLAKREEANQKSHHAEPAPREPAANEAAPVPEGTSAAELLHADDSVTTGV